MVPFFLQVICGCALVYGMSLSLLVTSALAYTAVTTTTSSQYTTSNTSSHNTILAQHPTTVNPVSFSETFSERPITRKRRLPVRPKTSITSLDENLENINISTDLQHANIVVGGIDKEAVLERLGNSTSNNDVINNTRTNCLQSDDTPSWRFESRLQHGARQTRLSVTFDILENAKRQQQQQQRHDSIWYSEMDYTSDRSNPPHNGIKCPMDQSKKTDNHYNPMSPLSHLNHREPTSFIHNHPQIFGMTVI